MTTKVTPETHSFCCLGVKAYLDGAFEDSSGVDPSDGHYPGRFLGGEDSHAQIFATRLNDDIGLNLFQISLVFEALRRHGESITKDIQDEPVESFNGWIDALRSGDFEQLGDMLAMVKS